MYVFVNHWCISSLSLREAFSCVNVVRVCVWCIVAIVAYVE